MPHLDEGTLHALVDGEIASEELAAIRTHLEGCADCRVRLDEATAMAGEAEQLVEVIEVPLGGRQGGRAAGRQHRRQWPVRQLAWAASIVVAAGLGYAGGREQQTVPEAPRDVQAGREQFGAQRVAPPATAPLEAAVVARDTAAVGDQERQVMVAADRVGGLRRDDTLATNQAAPQTVPALDERVDTTRMAKTLAAESSREAAADAAAPAPAPPRVGEEARARPNARQRSAAEASRLNREPFARSLRLEELVVTSAFVPVTLEEANRLLGGRLRRVDGLVPERVQARDLTVQVVYPLADGVLILEQYPEADSVAVRLTGPPSITPDSLARLYSRIR